MPNKENLRKVVAALRSGNYQQGNGALEYKDENGVTRNCCLGVACRVALDNGVELTVVYRTNELLEGDENTYQKIGFRGGSSWHETNFMPPNVVKWLGLNHENPQLKSIEQKGDFQAASRWNDMYDADFDEIADMFELTFELNEAD